MTTLVSRYPKIVWYDPNAITISFIFRKMEDFYLFTHNTNEEKAFAQREGKTIKFHKAANGLYFFTPKLYLILTK
jgi:hypothetical protein